MAGVGGEELVSEHKATKLQKTHHPEEVIHSVALSPERSWKPCCPRPPRSRPSPVGEAGVPGVPGGMLMPDPGLEELAASRALGSAGSLRDRWGHVPRHKGQSTGLPMARFGKYYDDHQVKSMHKCTEILPGSANEIPAPSPLFHLPFPRLG